LQLTFRVALVQKDGNYYPNVLFGIVKQGLKNSRKRMERKDTLVLTNLNGLTMETSLIKES